MVMEKGVVKESAEVKREEERKRNRMKEDQ